LHLYVQSSRRDERAVSDQIGYSPAFCKEGQSAEERGDGERSQADSSGQGELNGPDAGIHAVIECRAVWNEIQLAPLPLRRHSGPALRLAAEW
jgi:hypothetical protein